MAPPVTRTFRPRGRSLQTALWLQNIPQSQPALPLRVLKLDNHRLSLGLLQSPLHTHPRFTSSPTIQSPQSSQTNLSKISIRACCSPLKFLHSLPLHIQKKTNHLPVAPSYISKLIFLSSSPHVLTIFLILEHTRVAPTAGFLYFTFTSAKFLSPDLFTYLRSLLRFHVPKEIS